MSKMQNALTNGPLCGYEWCTDDDPANLRDAGRVRDKREALAEIKSETVEQTHYPHQSDDSELENVHESDYLAPYRTES